jgi:hypothetical protein
MIIPVGALPERHHLVFIANVVPYQVVSNGSEGVELVMAHPNCTTCFHRRQLHPHIRWRPQFKNRRPKERKTS